MEQIHIHWSKRQHQITTGNKRNKEFTSLTNTVSNGFVFWVSGSYGFICSADASEVLTSSIMFVSIQRHIFCKLNVLLSLNGSALFRPRQSLQMDAEALRQLKVKIKHTHTHTHTRTHTRTHARAHTRTRTHTHARAHARTRMHTRTHAHKPTRGYWWVSTVSV